MGTKFSEVLKPESMFDVSLASARRDSRYRRPSVVPPLDLTRDPRGRLKRRMTGTRSTPSLPAIPRVSQRQLSTVKSTSSVLIEVTARGITRGPPTETDLVVSDISESEAAHHPGVA